LSSTLDPELLTRRTTTTRNSPTTTIAKYKIKISIGSGSIGTDDAQFKVELLSVASKRHPDLGVTFATTVSEWLQRGQANVRCSQLGFFVGSMPSTNIGQPHLVHRGRPIGAGET
jgi:hypothetical protein